MDDPSQNPRIIDAVNAAQKSTSIRQVDVPRDQVGNIIYSIGLGIFTSYVKAKDKKIEGVDWEPK